MRELPRLPGLRPGSAADIEAGLEQPVLTISAAKSQELRRLRRQHLARQLHRLGSRATFEFLDEIARRYGLADDIDARLARYAGADPAILQALGGDKFAPLPLRLAGGGR